jgi:hypothetical protein
MKDAMDMVIDVRGLINPEEVTSMVDKIHSNVAPDGATGTYIVVNSINITNTQDQIGSGNINIHVPSIGAAGKTGPDQAKLYSIGKVVTEFVSSQYRDTFRTIVTDGAKIFRDADGTYFLNIRYKYYSLQGDFKDI